MDSRQIEELVKKHKVEQRDLQARITQKKKNATKKTRKGINDECQSLEREMHDRHAKELNVRAVVDEMQDIANEQELDPQGQDDAWAAPITDKTIGAAARDNAARDNITFIPIESFEQHNAHEKKPNRQKARLARRAAEQAQAASQAAQEAGNLPDRRAEEKKVMVQEFQIRGLEEKEVRSDGHCLYAAIADQLRHCDIAVDHSGPIDYRAVRRDAACFISEHPDDFAAFIEEPLDSYVEKIRETGEWGGQLEMSALSQAYGITINVIQGDGRLEKIATAGSQDGKEIWLAYYRHAFGLGEHYNSLRAKP
jgi:OTU domain-containing protein 6